MTFRSYHSDDKPRVLEIFHSNCPKYFHPEDALDLIDFLDNYADENYLIVISNDRIIGCGGHYTKEDRHGIAWVMFEQGVVGSSKLLPTADIFFSEMEQRIQNEGKSLPIHIHTTQLMERLFNRYGFTTDEVIKGGFGEGLDEYKMSKE